MRALLAQLTPECGALERNAQRAADAIRAHPDAELAVFPELYLSGYRVRGVEGAACLAGGLELDPIAAACAAVGTAAAVGFAERSSSGFHNSVACIDERGEYVGTYRKAQLFGAEAEEYEPGEWLEVFELAGRAVAPLVCFDVEFPELARAAAMAGADLLVTCSANMEPFGREHRLHVSARALENRIPHLYVNRGGGEEGNRFVGESCAVDADGVVLCGAEGAAEELLVAEVGRPGASDQRVDYLAFEPTRLPVEVRIKSHPKGGSI
jgi:predicted amidohydrolase